MVRKRESSSSVGIGLAPRLGLTYRPSFRNKPHLRINLWERRCCGTPHRKNLRREDSLENVLGVVMVGVDVVEVMVVGRDVVVVEVVDEGYLMEVEVMED